MKKILRYICIVIIFTTFFNTTIYAAIYNDVPQTYWGYNAINRVSDKGIIVGDTSGNYYPNTDINMFEFAKILASMSGYKYTNISKEEQAYYTKSFNKNLDLLNEYSLKYKKWDTSANREIAYLLEKQILTPNDLKEFIIYNKEKEVVRPLIREEMAIFITRILGKEEEALSLDSYVPFADDEKISKAHIKCVYFLREMGIVSGDSDNNFNPKGVITRSSLAVLIDKTLELDKVNMPVTAKSFHKGFENIETVTVNITKIIPSLDAVEFTTKDGKATLYKYTPTTTISIDDFLKTKTDLKVGMSVIAVVNGNNVIDIKAKNDKKIEYISENTFKGRIKSIKEVEGNKNIEIEQIVKNNKNENIINIKTFTLAEDANVLRNGVNVLVSDISLGDNGEFTTYKDYIRNINVEDKNIYIIDGEIIEKKYIKDNLVPILIIKNRDNKVYEFKINQNSFIKKSGAEGKVTHKNLRVGDIVSGSTFNGDILELTAKGETSNVTGYVDAIEIGRNISYVTLISNDNYIKYPIFMDKKIDVYSLRIGAKINLSLDSKEVSNIVIIGAPKN